jgi:hypothetical protein
MRRASATDPVGRNLHVGERRTPAGASAHRPASRRSAYPPTGRHCESERGVSGSQGRTSTVPPNRLAALTWPGRRECQLSRSSGSVSPLCRARATAPAQSARRRTRHRSCSLDAARRWTETRSCSRNQGRARCRYPPSRTAVVFAASLHLTASAPREAGTLRARHKAKSPVGRRPRLYAVRVRLRRCPADRRPVSFRPDLPSVEGPEPGTVPRLQRAEHLGEDRPC